MTKTLLALPALALAAGCATTPAPPPTSGSIVYETGPCFGTCPVYRAAADAAGVTFDGQRFTAVAGERRVAAPGAYARVDALLRRWRPKGTVRYAMGEPNCRTAPTDMPSVKVSWRDAGGATVDAIDFYYGCSGDNRELADALRKVPSLLPIGDLIGKR